MEDNAACPATAQLERGMQRSIGWSLAAMALIALGLGSCASPEKRATEAWNEALDSGSQRAYRQFLEEFGTSDEAGLARERLDALERSAEESAWQAAAEADGRKSYSLYLSSSTLGAHAAEARERIVMKDQAEAFRGGGHTEPSLSAKLGSLLQAVQGNQSHDIEMAEALWAFFEPRSLQQRGPTRRSEGVAQAHGLRPALHKSPRILAGSVPPVPL